MRNTMKGFISLEETFVRLPYCYNCVIYLWSHQKRCINKMKVFVRSHFQILNSIYYPAAISLRCCLSCPSLAAVLVCELTESSCNTHSHTKSFPLHPGSVHINKACPAAPRVYKNTVLLHALHAACRRALQKCTHDRPSGALCGLKPVCL